MNWLSEAGNRIMQQKAMMDVFDGRCAILEPMMRECGGWVRNARHQQHPDCDRSTCGNTKTVKLDVETNDNIIDKKMCGRVETPATALEGPTLFECR